jgi:hypothetical protein
MDGNLGSEGGGLNEGSHAEKRLDWVPPLLRQEKRQDLGMGWVLGGVRKEGAKYFLVVMSGNGWIKAPVRLS